MSDIRRAYNTALSGQESAIVSVRHGGTSHEIALDQLALRAGFSDNELKSAVANHLDIGTDSLNKSYVERLDSGHYSIRPQAVFGGI